MPHSSNLCTILLHLQRGPRKHLKALAAPKNFMLGRLHGVWVSQHFFSECFLFCCSCIQAPRPSSGPHKLRECLPLVVMLRNRLKLALTKREVTQILMQRYVKVDGKVRTDSTFPAGFMGKLFTDRLYTPNYHLSWSYCSLDVVSITKTDENFRLLYDTKGRFALHKIKNEESKVGDFGNLFLLLFSRKGLLIFSVQALPCSSSRLRQRWYPHSLHP